MRTLKASLQGIERIIAEIARRRWTVAEQETEPLKAASKVIFRQVTQEEWKINDPQWLLTLEKHFRVSGSSSLSSIADVKNQISRSLEKPVFVQIEDLIEQGEILAKDISYGTWSRFVQGKERIKAHAFQAYCEVLSLHWEDLVDEHLKSRSASQEYNDNNETIVTLRPISPSLQEKQDSVQDWGEAIDTSDFYGRDEEQKILERWLLRDRCRLIAVLGMGGIGKTSLSTKVAKQHQHEFSYVIWRSLRNSPALNDILASILEVFPSSGSSQFATLEENIATFMRYLKQHRCLVLFDNMESILQGNHRVGQYREGYEEFGDLFRRVAEQPHISCLMLTSREMPNEVSRWEGETQPVRAMPLRGLGTAATTLLEARGLRGSNLEFQRLIDLYQGNPLALQIVPQSVKDLYRGSISDFLEGDTAVFGEIYDLLETQFSRLSSAEQEIIYWLAIEREPTSFKTLKQNVESRLSQKLIIEALGDLKRRSLIEIGEVGFTLQNVVMEYITEQLILEVADEIEKEDIKILKTHALSKAESNDYVRNTQIRLILQPIAQKVLTSLKQVSKAENCLKRVLSTLQNKSSTEVGFAATNILYLTYQINHNLRDYDFSNQVIQQAYLQGIELCDVNFSHSELNRCIFTQKFGCVFSVKFSPRGDYFAAGDTTSGIYIWRTLDCKQLHYLEGHTGWIYSIAFSQDGQWLASGSKDHQIKLWNPGTGEYFRDLYGHTDTIRSLAFDSSRNILASGSDDRTIRLWNLTTGQSILVLTGHSGWIYCIAFGSDQLLASCGADRTIKIWDTNTGNCLHTLHGHEDIVYSIQFGSNNRLASGSGDGTVRIWDLSTGQCLTVIHVESHVWSMDWNSQGILASGSSDQTVKLWDSDTGQLLKSLQGHTNWIQSIAFSPDGNRIASSSGDQTVKLWDVEDLQNSQCLRTLQGYTDEVHALAISPNSRLLVSGSSAATRLWDLSTHQMVRKLREHQGEIWAVAFSPDGEFVAAGDANQTIRIWNAHTGQCLKVLKGHTLRIRSIAFSPNGRWLASGCADQTIKVWEVTSGRCIKTLHGNYAQVRAVAFCPEGRFLAGGYADQVIRVWNVQTEQCVKTLQGHTGQVWAVVFSHDGTELISGSADGTIKFWSIQTEQCLQTLQGHEGTVWSVALSSDGNLLASGGEDKTVKLWSKPTGRCFTTLAAHENRVLAVAFSPDGTVIASGSEDENVRLWSVHNNQCISALRGARPYERMNITGAVGLAPAQRLTLLSLGAVEQGG